MSICRTLSRSLRFSLPPAAACVPVARASLLLSSQRAYGLGGGGDHARPSQRSYARRDDGNERFDLRPPRSSRPASASDEQVDSPYQRRSQAYSDRRPFESERSSFRDRPERSSSREERGGSPAYGGRREGESKPYRRDDNNDRERVRRRDDYAPERARRQDYYASERPRYDTTFREKEIGAENQRLKEQKKLETLLGGRTQEEEDEEISRTIFIRGISREWATNHIVHRLLLDYPFLKVKAQPSSSPESSAKVSEDNALTAAPGDASESSSTAASTDGTPADSSESLDSSSSESALAADNSAADAPSSLASSSDQSSSSVNGETVQAVGEEAPSAEITSSSEPVSTDAPAASSDAPAASLDASAASLDASAASTDAPAASLDAPAASSHASRSDLIRSLPYLTPSPKLVSYPPPADRNAPPSTGALFHVYLPRGQAVDKHFNKYGSTRNTKGEPLYLRFEDGLSQKNQGWAFVRFSTRELRDQVLRKAELRQKPNAKVVTKKNKKEAPGLELHPSIISITGSRNLTESFLDLALKLRDAALASSAAEHKEELAKASSSTSRPAPEEEEADDDLDWDDAEIDKVASNPQRGGKAWIVAPKKEKRRLYPAEPPNPNKRRFARNRSPEAGQYEESERPARTYTSRAPYEQRGGGERSYERRGPREDFGRSFDRPVRSSDGSARPYDRPPRSFDGPSRSFDRPARSYERSDNRVGERRSYDRPPRSNDSGADRGGERRSYEGRRTSGETGRPSERPRRSYE